MRGIVTGERRCPECEAVMELSDECQDCIMLRNVPMKDGRIRLNRQTLTHCKAGHLFTEENTYWRKRKDRPTKASRICKICRLEMERIRRSKAVRK